MPSLETSTNIAAIQYAEKAGAASTPTAASGRWKLYFKATGLYYIDDAGVETQVAGGGIGAFTSQVTIVGSADEIQLLITGNATQTTALQTWRDSGSNVQMQFGGDGSAIFNEEGNSVDLRVEGNNDANTFVVDGSADRIGIGTVTPTARFNVIGRADEIQTIIRGFSTQTGHILDLNNNSDANLRGWNGSGHDVLIATATSDAAPTDDTSLKTLTLQRLASDPSNAAYIKFSNSPGTPTNDFYLVLEEG